MIDVQQDQQAKLLAFQTLLDSSRDAAQQQVDMATLRKLCARGIPDHPRHLRQLSYLLLLGVLPTDKRAWKRTLRQQREAYYALLAEHTDPVMSDGVKHPLSSTDALLVRLSNEIGRVQSLITALRKHTAVNGVSRLRRQDLNRLVDPAERSAEESSSGDEGTKREPAEPLRRRRLIFSRLGAIAKAEQSHSPASKAMASPDSVAAEVMSPRITLSPDSESRPTRLGALRPPPLATPSLSLSLPESSTSESKPNSPITLLSPRVIPPVGSASFPTLFDDDPDTHADSVLRLAYVLCRSHPEWATGNVVDVAAQLYLVLVRKHSHPLLDGFAEEQTYWALEAIVRDSQSFLTTEVREPVNAIGRRVAWADRHFWSVLQQNRLDPVLYADHWVRSILAFLPPPALLPVWDLLFSDPSPRTDMVVDICAAMILASKEHLFIQRSRSEQGLWADDDEGEIDPQRSLAALQAFPIEQIGTDPVLDVAFELRQARIVAELIGDDPDKAIEPSWAAKMSTKVTASDAAATVSKLSSNWAAAAMLRWNTAKPSVGSISNWWSSGASDPSDRSEPTTPASASPDKPPRFVSPNSTIKHALDQLPNSITARRGRSDSGASGISVTSLQERLSGLASGHQKSASQSSLGGPRPLLLSSKARRASHSSQGTPKSKRDSSPVGTPSAALSPPPSGEINGLYRVGSNRSSRSSLQLGEGKTLDYGEVQTAAALAIGGLRRPSTRRFALPVIATGLLLARLHSNYPGHVPLNWAQNALLAVGSGVVGVLDTTRGDLIATLSESTASTFLPRLHDSMISHPEGRQILRDRPMVSSQTVDLDKLKGMRRGTLGREYVEWLVRGNVTPDTRETVRYIDSPSLAYTMTRYRQTHDLYHTLFSLPPTLPHELTLKVVELSNMRLPVAALSSIFGPLRLSQKRRDLWLQDWAPWALRVGSEGRSLVGVYWEKRWEQGVGELRRELGVSRNEGLGVEARWRGYREMRDLERQARRTGEWVDEPEHW